MQMHRARNVTQPHMETSHMSWRRLLTPEPMQTTSFSITRQKYLRKRTPHQTLTAPAKHLHHHKRTLCGCAPTDHQLRCMGEMPKYHNKISPNSGMAIALHDFATSILHFRRSNQLLHFIHQTLAPYFCGILIR